MKNWDPLVSGPLFAMHSSLEQFGCEAKGSLNSSINDGQDTPFRVEWPRKIFVRKLTPIDRFSSGAIMLREI